MKRTHLLKPTLTAAIVLLCSSGAGTAAARSLQPAATPVQTGTTPPANPAPTGEQKTYEGPFTFHNAQGTAKYQYYTASDGTRIYDGTFEFESTGFRARGQFKNNCQVGQWIYQGKHNAATINFDEKGYLNGGFAYINGPANVSGTMKRGRLTSLKYRSDEFYTSGKYDGAYSESPIGIWQLNILSDPSHRYTYENNYRNKPTTVVFSGPGYCTDWYFTDPSTGDKKRPQRGDYTLKGPEVIMKWCRDEAKKNLSVVLLQRSAFLNGYHP